MATKPASSVAATVQKIFPKLGLSPKTINSGVFSGAWGGAGEVVTRRTPIDGSVLARVRTASEADYDRAVSAAHHAFQSWRDLPAPMRGEVVRRLGNALRDLKHELGLLVSLEAGKIPAEGEGEVQEMIDICDFATGLSRQLHGLVIASERPGHRMLEQWHPLGVVGIISAFNFPVAVWSWNSAIAAVCGDATLWKPAEKVPLTAIASTRIAERVCRDCDVDPAVFSLVVGPGSVIGERMARDSRLPLISATGSTPMGKRLAGIVAQRFGRTILELGGNNAIIVTPSADLNLAKRAILFGAVGTAGQRSRRPGGLLCTNRSRTNLRNRSSTRIDNCAWATHWIRHASARSRQKEVNNMMTALKELKRSGGRDSHRQPTIVRKAVFRRTLRFTVSEAKNNWPIVQRETFAPILYLITYRGWTRRLRCRTACLV